MSLPVGFYCENILYFIKSFSKFEPIVFYGIGVFELFPRATAVWAMPNGEVCEKVVFEAAVEGFV